MSINSEIWKPVIGYEGIYEVSNIGRVKSLKFGKEKILKLLHAGRDRRYFQVILSKGNAKKQLFVHRLVYEAFVGLIPEGLTIDHIDCNPRNNTVENLQVLTREENSRKGGLKRVLKKQPHTIFYNLPPKLAKFLSDVIHRDFPDVKIIEKGA
jgi:hypothetical protein